ncbi:MAG: exodeoxyribonuclease III [Neisseriaceae bacterium]|nr:exodeoxyribonuclease III [Neisseriaceae bacterium]
MKIATWNINSLKVRLPQVLAWLDEQQADILALQELKLEHDKFPIEAFADLGFQAAWLGQKTYNGVAIISKKPLANVQCNMPNFADPQSRFIAATVDNLRVVCVYCVNGERLESDKFQYKKQWFNALSGCLKQELAQYQNVVLLGDFNIAPDNIDVAEAEKHAGKILCSNEERQWFQNLLALGFTDAVRFLAKDEKIYTWWDYRMNAFRRNLGMRIDHILLTPNLMQKTTKYQIDKTARATERPSDHSTVWVEIQ